MFYIFLFLFLVFDAYLTILLRNRVYNRTSLLKMIDELSLIDELVGIIVNRGISFGEALRVIRDITSRDSLSYILHYISRNLNVDLVPEEDMRDIFGDVIELPHIKNEVGGPTHKLNPGYLRESLIERLGRKITELESRIEGAEDVASVYNFIVLFLPLVIFEVIFVFHNMYLLLVIPLSGLILNLVVFREILAEKMLKNGI